MAALQGRQGLLKWKTKQIFRISNWTLNVNVDQLDVTAFSTDGTQWRSFLPGLSGWDGTCDGFHDLIGDTSGQTAIKTAVLTPATGTIILLTDETNGNGYTGAVYWRNMSVNVDVADSQKLSLGFQGTAALSWSTAL
jgi:predicted secreted protein